jgi:putative membrane protein
MPYRPDRLAELQPPAIAGFPTTSFHLLDEGTLMKRSSLAIAVAALLAASAAAAQTSRTDDRNTNTTNSTHATSSAAANTNAGSKGASDSTNRDDEKFLKNFAQANAAEVEAGKLASEQAQHPEVKAFGKHMVDDHSSTIKKVESLASTLNVDVKPEPDLMHKAKSALLDRKSGTNFDEAYIKAQVNDHQKVVDMLQKEIREGRNANVKQLASAALPDVQHHLDTARQLQAKVANGSRDSTKDATDSNRSNTSNRDSTNRDTTKR